MITIHDPILHGEKGSDRNKKLSEFSFTVDIDDVRDALSLAMAIRGLVALYFKNQLPVHAILKFIDEIPFYLMREEKSKRLIKITCNSLLIGVDLSWDVVDESAQGTSIRQITAINCDVRITAVVRNERDKVFLSELACAFLPLCFRLWLDESSVFLSLLNTADTGDDITLILTVQRGRLVYILFCPGKPELVHTVPFLEAESEFVAV